MYYLVGGKTYKPLCKKLLPNSCGDEPKQETCYKCGCSLIDTCYWYEPKPDNIVCYSCFGKMWIEMDKENINKGEKWK